MNDRHKRVLQAVIIQAIRDYADNRDRLKDERYKIREWVEKGTGTFDLCAMAWDKVPDELRRLMLWKMSEIDAERITKNGV